MEYIVKKFTINTPEEDLLNDLKRCAKTLKKNHVSYKEYNELGSYNCSTYMRRFGSWNNALLRAGLDAVKIINAPEEDLMLNIKHVWDILQRQPRYNDIVKPLSRFDVRVYVNRYGSWNNSLDEFEKFVISNAKAQMTNGKAQMTNGKAHPAKEGTGIKRRKAKGKKNNFQSDNLKSENPGSYNFKPVSVGLRLDILARDRFRCRGCGRSPATHNITLHVDHWKPRSKKGDNSKSNLVTLCNECNLGKGSKLLGIPPP